ncbi:MAG: TIGR01777 family oxidoreductase [Opitutaceae bacterium]
MKVAIAGASGLVGRALTAALRGAGHDVRRLVRRGAVAADEIAWNPPTGEIDTVQLEGSDAIVNLAGENLAAGRWTAARRERILRSRTESTRTLVAAIGKLARKPEALLNASAVGFYGDRGDEVLTERSGIGQGFLPEVCLAWETHAEGARRVGVRTVCLRFATILAREGGALAKMLPVFRLGLGGRFGDGRQWMSWVSSDDMVGAIRHALGEARCAGPINVAAPAPVTNAEFAATLGRVLRRPVVLPLPSWVLCAVFGQMANEALLASTRAVPDRLRETGFVFRHRTLESALRSALEK